MKYNKYPSYKDSGVEWLGEIPEHWEVIAIKRMSTVGRGASPRPIDNPIYFDDEGEYAWVRIADVSKTNGYLNTTLQQLSKLGSSLSVKIHPNELFISIAGTVGKPCISNIKACIHDGFVHFPQLAQNHVKLLFRIFEAGNCYGGLGKMGTQLNLNTETIGGIHISLAPLEEQQAIANYLDIATDKIDTLISKQTKLIELLKEKRQALISHAVTKGLNPHAKMKQSGVEWLGEIPQHWETSRLKFLCKITTGGKDTENKVDDGDYPFYVRSQTVERINSYSFSGEAILTAGDGVGVGKVFHYVDGKFDFHQRVYMFYAFKKVAGRFLFEYIKNNFYKVALAGMAKSTVDSLRLPLIQNFMITVPPHQEQQTIANYLDDKTQKIDNLIEKATKAIELLKERRTAIISSAVTGKIDARGIN